MNVQEQRSHIHKLIESVPENHLEQVIAFLASLTTDRAMTDLGCSADKYNEELDAALMRHVAGRSIPHASVMNIVDERIGKYGAVD